jgi:hypothetical protein
MWRHVRGSFVTLTSHMVGQDTHLKWLLRKLAKQYDFK